MLAHDGGQIELANSLATWGVAVFFANLELLDTNTQRQEIVTEVPHVVPNMEKRLCFVIRVL